jgi:hypothetical protein
LPVWAPGASPQRAGVKSMRALSIRLDPQLSFCRRFKRIS